MSPQAFAEQAIELSIFEVETEIEDDLDYQRRVLTATLAAVLEKTMANTTIGSCGRSDRMV